MRQFLLKYKDIILQLFIILLIFVAGLSVNNDVVLRIWSSLLIANWFFLLISVSGIFLLSLHYLTGAKWSEPLLPLLREFKKGIPFLSFTLLVMIAGIGNLFNIDELNTFSIIVKAILTVSASGLLFFVYFFDDIFRNRKFTEKQRSIIELLLLIPALYILSKVWLRDLYPTFSNPVFVFYLISCSLLSGLCIATLLLIQNYEDYIETHKKTLYNLGRYLMAIIMIRAYLWFTQTLIFSYAGISDEISIIPTNKYLSGYYAIGILFSFLIPFIMLLFGKVKANPKYMYSLAVLILIGQYFDLYNLVYNAAILTNYRLSLIDISVFYGFVLLFILYIRNRKIVI